ncbi:MAG: HD domain-containing protein [Patescibacteria group bacterium]|jgi:putative nucleotidyltransferase with HDIG domain
MKLPTQKQCFDLWDKYQMPENIKAHSRQVTKVADAIALHLEKQGLLLNKELINRGALMHDIAKIIAVNENRERDHSEMGSEIALRENLGNEISEIIRKHYMSTFNDQCTLEEQVVNYADKRVTHDRIVALTERFDYICKSYPAATRNIMENKQKYLGFEKKYQIDQLDLMER